MLKLILIHLFIYGVFINAQKIFNLRALKGESAINIINNGTTAIFVTATSDDNSILDQILISSGNGETISALDMKKRRLFQNSDSILPWVVSGVTTISTKLSNDAMAKLTGSVYCTTESQAKDKNFNVYDITKVQEINVDTSADDSTIVILNSQLKDRPLSPTKFFNWNQPSTTTVFMYNGIPKDTAEGNQTQIFSNPVYTSAKPVYIQSVQDFTTTLAHFYFRVKGSGGFRVSTSPQYYDVDKSVVKATIMTGFYMKSADEQQREITTFPNREPKDNGVTGANFMGSFPGDGSVYVSTFVANSASGFNFAPSDKISSWLTPLVGSTLTITPTNTDGGQYFIQYFVIQKAASSSSSTQSPHNMETTTKSGGVSKTSMIILLCSVLAFMI